jgi:hypothetical protein
MIILSVGPILFRFYFDAVQDIVVLKITTSVDRYVIQ